MELDAEGSLTVCETSDHISSLCVPELDHLVKTCTQESSAIIAEANVPHSLGVAHIGAEASLVSENIPNFDGGVMACREHEMS